MTTGPATGPLQDRIAVVTGASRGAGRGIALALGAAGATVVVTGRSARGGARTEGLPGTVDDTADAVTAAGGRGIAFRCDHTSDTDVDALAARVREDLGRCDLLVNAAWAGYERYGEARFDAPIWEQPLWRWDAMMTGGVRAALVTARALAPLLLASGRALVVNLTAWLEGDYLGNLIYDTAKAAVNRMAFGLAQELAPHGGTALALAPGFMRTERVRATIGDDPKFDWGQTESVTYVGRAVAALAADPDVRRFAGQLLYVGDLARTYGFRDEDDRQPPRFVVHRGA
jgi:NAD(P)-dependent dehydrogenase (short-subunit alcohol dehydrogenase family)